MKLNDVLNANAMAPPKAPKKDLDKDDFLRLLTTQLAQQDPLSPMDNQAFVSQLSQMATVEKLENLSSSMQNMAMAQSANTSAQVVSFIGQDVRVSSSDVVVKDGAVSHGFGFSMEGEASEVEVLVKDNDGRVVRTLTLSGREPGDHSVTWDGKDDNGNTLSDGTYTFSVHAESESGETVATQNYATRTVKGITFADGFPRLLFDENTSASLGEVIEVKTI